MIHKYCYDDERNVHIRGKNSLLSFNPLYFIAVSLYFPIFLFPGYEPIFEFKRSHFVCRGLRADEIADVTMKRSESHSSLEIFFEHFHASHLLSFADKSGAWKHILAMEVKYVVSRLSFKGIRHKKGFKMVQNFSLIMRNLNIHCSYFESWSWKLAFSLSIQLTFSKALRPGGWGARCSNLCNEFSKEKWGSYEKVSERSSVKNRFIFF